MLIRPHLKTGELAFHYCHVPEGQVLILTRLVRAAGLRRPVEEDQRVRQGRFGLDQSQVRLYTAIARHTVSRTEHPPLPSPLACVHTSELGSCVR